MTADGPSDDGDEALMLSYARGAAAAFDALYARHRGGVYRYVLRHCGDGHVADEIFQDVWMNVIRSRSTYTPTSRFSAWLYTLAHHRLVDHWRATGHVDTVSIDGGDGVSDAIAAFPAARADQPDERAEHRDLATKLRTALAKIPPLQRDALLLQHESGLSLLEIATLTGVGVETVKSRLRYAVAKLRDELGAFTEWAPR